MPNKKYEDELPDNEILHSYIHFKIVHRNDRNINVQKFLIESIENAGNNSVNYDENRKTNSDRGNAIKNYIENFLRSSNIGNYEILVDNYREREGSLYIDFTMVIIGVFTTYGSMREAIDYALLDLAGSIERVSNNSLDVDLNRSTPFKTNWAKGKKVKRYIKQVERIQKQNETNLIALTRRFKYTISLAAASLLFSISLVIFYNNREEEKEKNKLTPLEEQQLIEEKVRKVVNEGINKAILFRLLESKSDTTQH